jgi:hypothetical protein
MESHVKANRLTKMFLNVGSSNSSSAVNNSKGCRNVDSVARH